MHDATSLVMLQPGGCNAIEMKHVCICVVASMCNRDSKAWALQPHECWHCNYANMHVAQATSQLARQPFQRTRLLAWTRRGVISLSLKAQTFVLPAAPSNGCLHAELCNAFPMNCARLAVSYLRGYSDASFAVSFVVAATSRCTTPASLARLRRPWQSPVA